MNTEVSIHDSTAGPRVRRLVEQKLLALGARCAGVVSLTAHLAQEADQHRVAIAASVAHGPVLAVEARAGGVRGALDEALQRITRRLERARALRTTERRRRGRA
jgi:ribosome-associated translation inhibitor RaiA